MAAPGPGAEAGAGCPGSCGGWSRRPPPPASSGSGGTAHPPPPPAPTKYVKFVSTGTSTFLIEFKSQEMVPFIIKRFVMPDPQNNK